MLGSYRVGNWKFAYRAGYCTVCEAETVAEGRRSIVVMHVYFVPLFPVGLHTAWMCPHCVCDINTRRPTHPGYLQAAFMATSALAMIGAGMWITNHGLWERGAFMVALSVAMSLMVLYLLRKNRYAEYRENVRRVEPLLGDVCPVCGDALQEGDPPRCLFCDVNVLTN